ncbi:MAG: PKD domain-containing protein [Candidatus Binatia bacterium]
MQPRHQLNVPLPIILTLLALVSLLVSIPAFPATYVVDPAGDDANAGGAAAPWRTIQHAASRAVAGDRVVIRAGTYVESVYLSHSGTAAQPIIFAAQPGAVLVSPNPDASFEALNVAPGVAYITVTGIEATGGFDETIFLRSGAHDIQLQDCNLHHNHAGIIAGGAYNVTVTGCALHDNSGVGMRLVGDTRNVLVTDTDSFMNGDGATCSSVVDGFAIGPQPIGVAFVRARAYDNGGDGFDLKGDQITLEDIESSGNACTGIKLWANASVKRCLVTGNSRGFAVTSLPGDTTVDVMNCTVADNDGVGMDLSGFVPRHPYTARLRNSIIAGAHKAIQYQSAQVLSEAYNIFYRPDPRGAVLAPVRRRRFTGSDINRGLWARRSHQGEGTLAVDPLFVDPANGDFHVQPTSAAVGRGFDDAGSAQGPGVPPNIGVYQEPVGPVNHSPWAVAGRDRKARAKRVLRFKAKGSFDPDGDRLSYAWDFGDGSDPVFGFKAKHRYAEPGVYVVRLSVSDGTLSGSTTSQATIR